MRSTKLQESFDSKKKLALAEIRLADRIKQFRVDTGINLSELAAASQLSVGFLSRVENHKASLPIASLERVATALGVPLAAFFEEESTTLPIVVCRSGRGTPGKFRGPHGFLFEMLASEKRGKLMEPLIVDLMSAAEPMELKSHPGEEFNYVLRGECTLVYGDDSVVLRSGDSAYYDATVPHAASTTTGKGCKLLSVVASRDYLFHGDLTRLLNGVRK